MRLDELGPTVLRTPKRISNSTPWDATAADERVSPRACGVSEMARYLGGMAQNEILIAVGSAEDHRPVQDFLVGADLPPSRAEETWIEEATANSGRLVDGLYLSVRTDLAALGVGKLLAGHGWDAFVIDERKAKVYPAHHDEVPSA